MNSKIQYFQGSIWSSVKPRENKTKRIRIRNVKVMVLKKKKKKNQSGSRPATIRLWSVGVYLGKGGRRTGPSPAPALVTKAAAVGEELHAQVQ